MTAKTLSASLIALFLLQACGEADIILPGQRLAIRPDTQTQNMMKPISLPAPQANAAWTQRNGDADHSIDQVALDAQLTQMFAVNIGEGNGNRARITADPIVAGGRVFTLDARARVTATTTGGAPVWTTDVTPPTDSRTDASGGGLAYGAGRVFVTTGYGTLVALDPVTGGTIWTQDLDAPGTSAPTVRGNLVYVVSRDSTAWAIDATTGRIQWQIDGIPSVSSFGGGAGIAVSNEIAVLPFSSGEVIGVFPEGGLRRWGQVVSGERLGEAVANITDIAGDPVIDGNRVYVGNFSGRTVALDTFSGDRIWTASEGATGPVWPAGDSIFMINDINELLRLDKADGSVIWRVSLPDFAETGTFLRRNRTVYAHFGPIMAGNRLVVASSDGVLRSFDPRSGGVVSSVAIPEGAASNPVVANGILYVVNKAGQLLAFR